MRNPWENGEYNEREAEEETAPFPDIPAEQDTNLAQDHPTKMMNENEIEDLDRNDEAEVEEENCE